MKNIKHYRYTYNLVEPDFDFGISEITLIIFDVVETTPSGYWLAHEGSRIKQKWVLKDSKKRFAYPTKKEALTSLYHRTVMRRGFLQRDLNIVNSTLPKIENLLKKMNDENV